MLQFSEKKSFMNPQVFDIHKIVIDKYSFGWQSAVFFFLWSGGIQSCAYTHAWYEI